MTQIQTTAWAKEKNEDMLVCIIHGAIVLISSGRNLNLVASHCLAP
jgi:hypothetical protein